jgi:hypothetical protein
MLGKACLTNHPTTGSLITPLMLVFTSSFLYRILSTGRAFHFPRGKAFWDWPRSMFTEPLLLNEARDVNGLANMATGLQIG